MDQIPNVLTAPFQSLWYFPAALTHSGVSLSLGAHMCSSPGALVPLLQVTLCFPYHREGLKPADSSCSATSGCEPPCPACPKVSWAGLDRGVCSHQGSFSQESRGAARLHQAPDQSNPWVCSKWDQTAGAGSQSVQSLGSRHCHLHAHLLGFGMI